MAETSEEDATIFYFELSWMAWTSFFLHLHTMFMFWPFSMSKGMVPAGTDALWEGELALGT